MNRIYIETTIPSYLTARRSKDIIAAGEQETTIEWWADHRPRFELFTSEVVLQEAAKRDPTAAAQRIAVLDGLSILPVTDPAYDLAHLFIARRVIPTKVLDDAFHIAIATVHGMDFVLTWNCKHIANAEISRRLDLICQEAGYRMPSLCTPKQLMGD